MDEWKPLNTAPVDQAVLLGGWDIYGSNAEWREMSGVVFESSFFGLFKSKRYVPSHYTHWKTLPAPPKQD